MWFTLLFERLRWDAARSAAGRSCRRNASRRLAKPRGRYTPQLEALEDRSVPSGGYIFTTFDDPNAGTGPAQGIEVGGINNRGQIVGETVVNDTITHGFLLSDGQFTAVDDPNAVLGTGAFDINASGQIVGLFYDAKFVAHGFLLSQGQYTTLDDPNAGAGPGQGTLAEGINDGGQIVGIYVDPSGVEHGFLLSGGQYTTLDDPNAGAGFEQGTEAGGINDAGQIVGKYFDANFVNHGFLLSGGQYITLDDPNAGTGPGQGTLAPGINSRGQIVGFYADPSNILHGFLLSAGQYTTLDDPNAGTNGAGPQEGTLVSAITDSGRIDGWYIDSNFVPHGFLATPVPGNSAVVAVGNPASDSGASGNEFVTAAAPTNPTLPGIGGTGAFAVQGGDSQGGIPSQPSTIVATEPSTLPGSSAAGGIDAVSAAPVGTCNLLGVTEFHVFARGDDLFSGALFS